MRIIARLISIAVVLLIVLGVALLIRSKMPATQVGEDFRAWALFRDGSRLAQGSVVVIAGVRVGEVERLTIEGDFARVDLLLVDDLQIPIDSWVTKKATSAFGDSYIEIIPTGGEDGAATARMLKSGERLTHVIEGGSTDSVLRAIGRTMPKIDRGLDTIHDFALDGRRWVNGPVQDRILDLDKWVQEGHIENPIEAAARGMERAENATASAAKAIAEAKPDFDKRLDNFDRGITSARKRMAELRTGLQEGLANARSGMDRIDPTVEDMTEVMSAVSEGRGDDWKGTLGRLVNDPGAADTLEDLSESGKDAVASFNRFKSWLGLRVELNAFSKAARIYATAEIRARNDKFYLVEFEKGPLGGIPRDALRDAGSTANWTRRQEIRDEVRFTGQFGKRFGWLQVRGGIKDSTFGVGADALLNRGKLRLSADLFGSFEPVPRLKLAGALEVFRSAYILAGVDDALNAPIKLDIVRGNTDVPVQYERVRLGRDYFAGAIIQFTDEDLATLIRIYGALLVGLL